MSKLFQMSILVTPEVIDESEHVNNVEYLRWVQDISQKHWETIVGDEIIQKYTWMALDHHIQYKGQAFSGDELIIKTFIADHTAATCTRIVEIFKKDKLITKATTNWCMVNISTKKPMRIPMDILSLFI